MADSTNTVIAVAIVEQDRHFLIGKRPAGVPLAGYDEFPGGKVHPGEAPATAAKRECLEETGLLVNVSHQLDMVTHRYDHEQLQLYFFLCYPRENASPKPPFRWIDVTAMQNCMFPPANQRVVSILPGLAETFSS